MKLAAAFLLLAVALSPAAWSQQKQSFAYTQEQGGNSAYKNSPEHYFQLKFRVLNLSPEGKVANSRSYSETIASGPKSDHSSSIRTGDRVPVVTGHYSTGNAKSAENVQFQYIDIGTKIDANRAEVVDQVLRLHVTADISSMSTSAPGSAERPVIRQTSWDSNVTVPVDKPTIIFSSDNSADKGKTELELTAVPISQ
jgi:hypothetical protein